ncbi:MAG: RHS repeat protein [Myxococcales bacterium]|nr:RHS repeat protein [Myxococcales bacterium]
MCPGIAVAAGGGGGGGAGGKGSKKGKGKKGAGKKKGKKGAKGGKKGAKSGKGGKDKKSKCGDPVDVITGQVTTRERTDFELSGPVTLSMTRVYGSEAAHIDGVLGHGWTHSYGYRIEVHGKVVRVWDNNGERLDFDLPPVAESTLGLHGWVLRREQWGFIVDPDDETLKIFSETTDAGRTWLQTAEQDRNGNRVVLNYDNGRLVELIDSVGRVVRVALTREGRIAGMAVRNAPHQGKWIDLVRYQYDDAGNLVAAIDSAGFREQYTYDDLHRLLSATDKNGLTFFYRWDDKGRCYETWGSYGDKRDPSLAENLPKLLADNLTPIKGIFHFRLNYVEEGYTEVADCSTVSRQQGNEFDVVEKSVQGSIIETSEFDDNGNMTSFTDGNGATWKWVLDARGRILEEVDPNGHRITFERDALGNPIRRIDQVGAEKRFSYDRRGNLELIEDSAGASQFRHDERGNLVELIRANGARTSWVWDEMGNLIEEHEPGGCVCRYTYDYFGNLISATSPTGAVTRYAYGDRFELISILMPDGEIIRYDYDGELNLTSVTLPDGSQRRQEWGGVEQLCAVSDGKGLKSRMFYDWNGRLLEVRNAADERWTFKYDSTGYCISETTFDGRTFHFRHDQIGHVTLLEDAAGQSIKLEYDLCGRLTARESSDGWSEELAYDPRGLLVRAKSPDVECLFERDDRGNVVKEAQVVDGVRHEVHLRYDVESSIVERTTSLGYHERIERAGRGMRSRTSVGDGVIEHHRDPVGRELTRRLPGGGSIESLYDSRGELLRRAVLVQRPVTRESEAEPPWLGPLPPNAIAETRYHYQNQLLAGTWDQSRGQTRFDLDSQRELRSRMPEHGRSETFGYDACGNPFEVGPGAPARQYAAGSRLVQRGDTTFSWNDAGRLMEKRVARVDGEDVWRYTWNTMGMLVRVDRPDASYVEYRYDPFLRRVSKTISDESGHQVSRVRFVWDSDVLVHEIRESAKAAADPIVEERSYCFHDFGYEPIAQSIVQRHGKNRSEAVRHHYVLDISGAPARLVDDRGEIAAEYEHEAYDLKVLSEHGSSTPFGFLGQYRDDETGLAYNRHRYYDPETGQFISPDPIGLLGGLNDRLYGKNTYYDADPRGLALNAAATAVVDTIPDKTAGVYVIENPGPPPTKYVGKGVDVKARLKCNKHKKAQALLNKPGTKVTVHQVTPAQGPTGKWKNPHKSKAENVDKDKAINRSLMVKETEVYKKEQKADPAAFSNKNVSNSHQPLSDDKYDTYGKRFPPTDVGTTSYQIPPPP